MFEQLTLYPSWHVDRPDMPLRSRLYHLLPLGLGTPFVESLSSYVARLAQVHSVSISQLLSQEVLPLLDHLKPLAPGAINSWFKEIYTINGLGHHATNFVQALQQLTHHHNLRCLTMLSWANVLPTKNLLRRTRAWCPACYQSWLDEQIIYEPLFFALKPITACPIHHLPLSIQCPYPDCQRTSPLLSALYQPGYCSRCKRWLGQESTDNQTLNQDELAWQTWVSLSVGQLLAATPSLSVLPRRERIASVLSAHIEQLSAGNLVSLARKLPLPSSTLQCWHQGLRLPQLTSLLQLSYFLGPSPLAFLTQDPLALLWKQFCPAMNIHLLLSTKSSSASTTTIPAYFVASSQNYVGPSLLATLTITKLRLSKRKGELLTSKRSFRHLLLSRLQLN